MTRPSAAARGYNARWQRTRARYLRTHPTCALCHAPATIPDHWPVTRRKLVDQGVRHPDTDEHLRPLCATCHSRETALHDGGFGRMGSRKREPEPHPGIPRGMLNGGYVGPPGLF